MGQCNVKESIAITKTDQSAKDNKDSESMPEAKPIVTADWLKQQIDAGASNLRILDVTSSAGDEARQAYTKAHIPGAGFFSVFYEAKNTEYIARNVPEAEVFEAYVRSFGINNDTHVVVYDCSQNAGFLYGGRAWYLFKLYGHSVSVLDGGMNKWTEAGYPTSDDIPKFEEGNFKVTHKASLMKTYEDMVANLDSKSFQVADSRPKDAFSGSANDARSGHYPSAVNIPFSKLTDSETKRFLSTEKLKSVFEAAGLEENKPLVAMCRSGMSSCSVMIGAALIGMEDTSLYLPGFGEWGQRADEKQIEKSRWKKALDRVDTLKKAKETVLEQ